MTVSSQSYGMHCWSMTPDAPRDLNKLVKNIQWHHGKSSQYQFDIKLDATRFSDWANNRACHVGWHTDMMDNVIANDDVYRPWWGSFLKQYSHISVTKPVIKVLTSFLV